MVKNAYATDGQQEKTGVLRRVVMLACLLVGIGLILYPVCGTFFNSTSFSSQVTTYEEEVEAVPEDQRQVMLEAARAYNESLRGDPVHDPFVENSGFALPSNYNDILNVDGNGLIGTISIPEIDVELPIYHGTSGEVLEMGAGHIPQTSFPIGGVGTHAVITGHTGIPSKQLFTNLSDLETGDLFIINVLGERHAYAVDDIRIILPEEVSVIRVDTEHEYVTLLTCTPLGINSHRLLVRGIPTALPDEQTLEDLANPIPWNVFFICIVLFIVACIAWSILYTKRRQVKHEKLTGDAE